MARHGTMPSYLVVMGMFMVFGGPQVAPQDLHRCGIDFYCQFDWASGGYDGLVPFLEGLHARKGFWRDWRRSTNVEIAGQVTLPAMNYR